MKHLLSKSAFAAACSALVISASANAAETSTMQPAAPLPLRAADTSDAVRAAYAGGAVRAANPTDAVLSTYAGGTVLAANPSDAVLSAYAGGAVRVAHPSEAVRAAQARGASRAPHAIGLGKVLSTADGGQIYGFDIDQHGNDGLLASAQTVSGSGELLVSMESFNQTTGTIVKSFAKYRGKRSLYSFDGIFMGDVGLVTHYVTPKNSIYAKRFYEVMNPVTGNAFTGKWTPPIADIDVLIGAENQATSTSALFAIELQNQDRPDLIVSNIAANTFGDVIHLDPNLFGLGNGPQLAQFTTANEAVFALSPDGGAVGGSPPVNILVDLKTGKTTQSNGFNNGPYHAGYVNGLAVDPNTGIAATDTELNAQVEFYDFTKKFALAAVQLPCTGNADQLYSGSGITVDPVHKLFLVTQTYNSCNQAQGSALIVFDESGNVVETIPGFKFAIGEPPVAIDPSKRMGWAFGPGFNQLQQFFY